jgi:uncharacterized membrane protein YgcG
LTEKSTSFLSKSTIDSIFEKTILKIATEKGVKEQDLVSNYNVVLKEVEEKSNESILEHIQIIDRTIKTLPEKNTVKYFNLKKTYSQAIEFGIRKTFRKNNSLTDKLLAKDLSDRILSFDAELKIDSTGKLNVTEKIIVYNGSDNTGNNNTILRGITRDFPTVYTNKIGLKSNVPFKLIQVTRNNTKENSRSEKLKNGIRVFIGSRDYLLPEGIHRYTIQYETQHQFIYHADKDELYWNVNGNGWAFTIDRISCKIVFPTGSIIKENACYTGIQGSTSSNCNSTILTPNSIRFQSTKRFNQFEGLTIASAIEKGIMLKPSQTSYYLKLINENRFIFSILGLLIIFFFVHYSYWYKRGRDPKNGVIFPQFNPPMSYSPADVGYVYHQAYTPQLFAATLMDFAVRKLLHIDVSKEGTIFKSIKYSFSKPTERISDDRDYTLYAWYGFDPEELYNQQVVSGTYNSKIGSLNRTLENQLKSRLLDEGNQTQPLKKIFSLNNGYIGAGIFYIFCLLMALIVYATTFYMSTGYYIIFGTVLFLSIVIQFVFMKIIKAYTSEGRKIADEIHGFRMYLSTAEGLYFNQLTPPEKTLELYEKYLPYSIALGVENEWGDQFKEQLDIASQKENYNSFFYTTNHFSTFNGNSSFASSLSSTISSASTPPSSSSGGSSGGGSSGGGGGGGGGGGW